jgi:hypothetical protein
MPARVKLLVDSFMQPFTSYYCYYVLNERESRAYRSSISPMADGTSFIDEK